MSDADGDPARYPVPAQQHRVEQVIDRSRFICTVARVQSSEEAQAFIKTMNADFPDATHNCWAYVVGAPGSTDRVGMSDDGEPHGTAGRPMLTVLLHSGVGEVAAVVTRYYGGTKLGTGGLVKAYGGAVQEALMGMPRGERVDSVELSVRVGYGAIGALQQLFPEFDAELLEQRFDVDAEFCLRVPRIRLSAMEHAIQNATRGAAVFTRTD
ncbi:YigZ family protein [Gemmatimonas groenlandica]|uniref:YigZ family protein n=1 Tax=Gemmatimonas groenlandica TaxID=2732249 RepID=A0A6M4IQP2_9BACT|nr:YigZ family protein [Gemmatimonas groenlandica]QJR37050.1 YigZ family protein [Gemmatimonas groenlandica]